VVRGPADFAHVRPGDVLVCRTTDPAWTPLFGVVAAVVTETGGLLSHAAIVARELGLPAVLAIPDATTALLDGVPVEVDGSTGRVAPLGS
jgi:pyruvate,water dikinase